MCACLNGVVTVSLACVCSKPYILSVSGGSCRDMLFVLGIHTYSMCDDGVF